MAFDPRPIAKRFWNEVGYRPDFPRDLVRPIMETFAIAIIAVPSLSIAAVDRWLVDHSRTSIGRRADRPLRGCLLARGGQALIFLDGAQSPEQRRFALAHELAHYYAHYLLPRLRAVERFGDDILAVLDGQRLATTAERLSAIIQTTPIGPFEDFLGRDTDGRPSDKILEIETEADHLACELLAPQDDLMRLGKQGQALEDLLLTAYGLPPFAARAWMLYVEGQHPRTDPLMLGFERALKKRSEARRT